MGRFRWLHNDEPPACADLRRCGWELADGPDDGQDHTSPDAPPYPPPVYPRLFDMARQTAALWRRLLSDEETYLRPRVLLLSITDAAERAQLLRLGFGDAMGADIQLEELAARAERVADQAISMPCYREHAGLRLDLQRRDGWIDGTWLRLHPREFALLWHLAETPGQPLSSQHLLKQVWQLNFRPETNSLAVHVCRLRRKLAWSGLDKLLCTTDGGGYMLNTATGPVIALANDRTMLDDYTRNDPTRMSTHDRIPDPSQCQPQQ